MFYNPTYEVSLNGEVIGFTTNKSELQERINGFTEENKRKDNKAYTFYYEYCMCIPADLVYGEIILRDL